MGKVSIKANTIWTEIWDLKEEDAQIERSEPTTTVTISKNSEEYIALTLDQTQKLAKRLTRLVEELQRSDIHG